MRFLWAFYYGRLLAYTKVLKDNDSYLFYGANVGKDGVTRDFFHKPNYPRGGFPGGTPNNWKYCRASALSTKPDVEFPAGSEFSEKRATGTKRDAARWPPVRRGKAIRGLRLGRTATWLFCFFFGPRARILRMTPNEFRKIERTTFLGSSGRDVYNRFPSYSRSAPTAAERGRIPGRLEWQRTCSWRRPRIYR